MENLHKKSAGLASFDFNITATWRDLAGNIVKVEEKKNLIATIGRAVFAQRLAQDFTFTGAVKFGALGTNATAPANGDIKLGTEVNSTRKAPSTYSANSNKAFVTFVYGASEAVGTWTEFGNFIDGTSAVDSGVLFSHLPVNWTKTNAQSLTIDCVYTIS